LAVGIKSFEIMLPECVTGDGQLSVTKSYDYNPGCVFFKQIFHVRKWWMQLVSRKERKASQPS